MATVATGQRGMGTAGLPLVAMLGSLLSDPAMKQSAQFQAILRAMRGLGFVGQETGTAVPNRILYEFLSPRGVAGRFAAGANPRDFLMFVENAARQVNPAALLERAQNIGRAGIMGTGSARQVVDVLRALAGGVGRAGSTLPLLPLMLTTPGMLRQMTPGMGLDVEG